MEFPRNDLPEETKHFFLKMQEHIEEKIYFFGSITRLDYFQGHSDIDNCVFSENVESTLSKVKMYLGSNKYYLKKFYIKKKKIFFADICLFIKNLTFKLLI